MYAVNVVTKGKQVSLGADEAAPGTLLEGAASGDTYLRLEDGKVLNLNTNKVTNAVGTWVFLLPVGTKVVLTAQ